MLSVLRRSVDDDDLITVLLSFARVGPLQGTKVDTVAQWNIGRKYDTQLIHNLKAVQENKIVFRGYRRYRNRGIQKSIDRLHIIQMSEVVKANVTACN